MARGGPLCKILRSHAFLRSREGSVTIVESSEELRALADLVDTLDQASGPLAAVADRVAAAVRFLRDRANRLDDAAALTHNSLDVAEPKNSDAPSAGVATRERLLVASLHYLVTPDDLVPDFRAGGYIDDEPRSAAPPRCWSSRCPRRRALAGSRRC